MLKQIGKYQILEEIGRGGFGRVYRCFDPTVGRVVALKLLLPDATDPEHLGRFRMEAATTGNLRHRNLVVIHEFGEQDGLQYLVMEFLEGEDLQKRMRSMENMPLYEKIEVMQQVAVGLHCAHDSGVVHRDVKPSNVMLLRDGTVKVMDFGIARLTRADSTRMTKTGYLVGTLNYMSPEQFRDADVDPLCDIWAYGVIYYEFLTGKHPFEAPTAPSLMYAITNQEPAPIRSLMPSCPPALEKIVMRAIAKDRELRYQSLEELHLDVQPILLDLRRDRARALLPEAQRLFEEQKWDETQALVRRILDLNPMETEARALREKILQQSQRRAILPKIVALRQAAEEHLRNRRFQEAAQGFEAAARLDQGNKDLMAAAAEAKAAGERSRRAQQLLETALSDLVNDQLTSANRNAAEASRIDPDNPSAVEVLGKLKQALEDRDRINAASAALERARALVTARAHPEALALLRDIEQRHPEAPGLAELMTAAEQIRDEELRRARRESGLSAAKASLRAGDPSMSLQQLQRLLPEFAQDPDVQAAMHEAQRQQQRSAAQQAAAQTLERAKVLLGQRDWDGAIQCVERGLREVPGDGSLTAFLQECHGAKERAQREAALLRTLQTAESLRQQTQYDPALAVLVEALRGNPAEPRLMALRQAIEHDQAREARREALRRDTAEVRGLLGQKRHGEAIQKAEQWLQSWGAEPEMQELLQSAQRLDSEARLREGRQRLLERLRGLEAASQIEEALRVLDAESARYAGDAELGDLRRRFAERLGRERDERVLADKIRQVETALTGEQLERAGAMLADLRRTHPHEPAVPRLSERLRQLEEESQTRKTAEGIEKALAAQNLKQAEELLTGALRSRPQEPRFVKLQQLLDAERSLAESVAQAYVLLRDEQPELAEASVRALLTLRTDHPLIWKLRKDIEAAQKKAQKERQKTLAELASKLAKGQFEDVLAISGRSLTRHPNDPEFRNYIDRAEVGMREAQRQRQAQMAEAERREAEAAAQRRKAAQEKAALAAAAVPGAVAEPASAGKPLLWVGAAVLASVLLGGGGYLGWKQWKGGSAKPTWQLSAEKLSLRWQIGQPDLATAEVQLVGAVAGEEFLASSEAPWLNLVTQRVQAPEAIRAVLSPGALAPGSHRGRIVVKAAEGERSRAVEVELIVVPRAVKAEPSNETVRVDRAELEFRYRRGDVAPAAKAVRVNGTGVAGVRVTVPVGGDWLTVDRTDGVLPMTLQVAPKVTGLGVGAHTGLVQIVASHNNAVVTRVAVKMVVEEAVKVPEPVVATNPPPKVAPTPAPAPAVAPGGVYQGELKGRVTWTGELAAGAKLTIDGGSVVEGGGSLKGRLPGDIGVTLQVMPPTVKVEVAPGAENRHLRMVLVNTASTAVRFVQVQWAVRQ